jgi:hypothetical protein
MWDFVIDKSGAGVGFLRELRFPLPVYIPSASPQSSSLSPEARSGRSANSLTNHILLSHIRDSPNLEGQIPVFVSPRKRVAQLYPEALDSVFVASYDTRGYGGSIPSMSAGLGSSLYSLWADTTENTVFSQFLYCYRDMFTSSLHRNGSSIVRVFISSRSCLPSRCQAMNVYSSSAILSFRRHATVSFIEEGVNMNGCCELLLTSS